MNEYFRFLIPLPAFKVQVGDQWPHARGRLRWLLEYQHGKCAVCAEPAQWPNDKDCTLGQWIGPDELLWGLVCKRCLRRYKTLGKQVENAHSKGLPAFLANPPGQRCPQTRGRGYQTPPRHFKSRLAPVEVPPPSWRYSFTVTHSLFLRQHARCAICSTGLKVDTDSKSVHVDHEEPSGLIRGLLCRRCNTCLGQDWELEWWEHNAPSVESYLAWPSGQTFHATRGLKYSQRGKKAVIAWSEDLQEVLLDGMPISIQGHHSA